MHTSFFLLLSALSFTAGFSMATPKHNGEAAPSSKSVGDMVAPDPPKGVSAVFDEQNILVKTPSRMNYVSSETVKATIKRDPSGFDSLTRGAIWQEHNVWVENGRRQAFALHPNGFELVPNDPIAKDIDFLDKDSVLDNYYPHCEQLLAKSLSSSKSVTVRAFDHNVRKQASQGETVKPLGLVHGDYTETSGPRRLQLLAQPPKINDVWRERLGDAPLLDETTVRECIDGKRRWALINVWRNIDPVHPVQSLPLACIDAQTHKDEDLRVLELHYSDRVGENFMVCPSERHRWIYFPQMTYDEAVFIKQWDSSGGGSDDDVSTFCIHSAFLDPTTQPRAPPRQSIEVRCVAIWD